MRGDRRRARRQLRRRRQRPAPGRPRARQRSARRARERSQPLVEFLRILRRPFCDRGRHRPQVLDRARTGPRHRLRRRPAPPRGRRHRGLRLSTCRDSSYLRKPSSARTLDAAEQLFRRVARGRAGFRARPGRALPDARRALPSRARSCPRCTAESSLRTGAGARQHGTRSSQGRRQLASRDRRCRGSGGRLPPRARASCPSRRTR